MVLSTRYSSSYMGIMVWRNRWILETQPSVCTNPKLSMLKTYGLHFLCHCSTFLELRSFSIGLSFKFSPSVAFSGPYWLMLQEFLFFFFLFNCCRSFLICLPVYSPCHWAYSHQSDCLKPCSDHVALLSKVWRQRLSAVWPQPTSPSLQHEALGSMGPHYSLTASCFSTSPELDSSCPVARI